MNDKRSQVIESFVYGRSIISAMKTVYGIDRWTPPKKKNKGVVLEMSLLTCALVDM